MAVGENARSAVGDEALCGQCPVVCLCVCASPGGWIYGLVRGWRAAGGAHERYWSRDR